VVVLDSGHGDGPQNGGSSSQPLENELTLDLARRVRGALAGIAEVVLTRENDGNPSLRQRTGIAERAQAGTFVSIHFNRSNDRGRQGTEAWIHTRAGDA